MRQKSSINTTIIHPPFPPCGSGGGNGKVKTMKFTVQNAKPSNEGIEILLPLLPLAVILVKIGYDKFQQWKYEKQYNAYQERIKPIHNAYRCLDRIGWIVGQPLNHNMRIPNSNTKGVKTSSAKHAIRYELLKTALIACKNALTDLLKFYISGNTTDKLETLVGDLQNKVPVRRDKNGKLEVEFKKDGASWPSDPYYKSLDKICTEFSTIGRQVYHLLDKAAGNASDAYKKGENEKDENKVKEYATFINCVDILAFMSLGVINEFADNLGTIEVESSVEDDSDPNTYWNEIEVK